MGRCKGIKNKYNYIYNYKNMQFLTPALTVYHSTHRVMSVDPVLGWIRECTYKYNSTVRYKTKTVHLRKACSLLNFASCRSFFLQFVSKITASATVSLPFRYQAQSLALASSVLGASPSLSMSPLRQRKTGGYPWVQGYNGPYACKPNSPHSTPQLGIPLRRSRGHGGLPFGSYMGPSQGGAHGSITQRAARGGWA